MTAVPRGPCAVCQTESTDRCSLCHVVYYCGKEHQSQHWKTHRPDCKRVRQVAESVGVKLGSAMVAEDAKDDTKDGQEIRRLKARFDKIRTQYGLDKRSDEVTDFLVSGGSDGVSPANFSARFNMPVADAEAFLAWIQMGVHFKETAMDPITRQALGLA
eukprot:TRINITY_DN24363_c0_g1_i1.p1 TRINITY_DN24363_c0_g1~~TRINITY_DN24363_c0_g1_i1.p1  ORF type:complete len:159 (-),score=14.22 TRINITY_DN24363_c0_g1_i1:46-522(-)